MPIHTAFGVRHVWLIAPELRILEVFENHEGRWLMLGGFQGQDGVPVVPV